MSLILTWRICFYKKEPFNFLSDESSKKRSRSSKQHSHHIYARYYRHKSLISDLLFSINQDNKSNFLSKNRHCQYSSFEDLKNKHEVSKKKQISQKKRFTFERIDRHVTNQGIKLVGRIFVFVSFPLEFYSHSKRNVSEEEENNNNPQAIGAR